MTAIKPKKALNDSKLPPLSLYVHIPWCVRKCPYCDFNSHTSEAIPHETYLRALLIDLETELEKVDGRLLQSIFIGGGTPSLFPGKLLKRLIDRASLNIGFSDNIEITLEANPGTIEYDSFDHFGEAGVNRISFGIQSFNDKHLKRLGRIHTNREAVTAFERARKAGFKNINIDLMHGLPDQSPEDATHDLQQAFNLEPTHISWYQLTIEPNTVFYTKPPVLPNDDALSDIQDSGEKYLATEGYKQYEVSAFAKPDFQSHHNLNYWQFGDYLAIGAGAHGKITQKDGSITRYRKTRSPDDYLNRISEGSFLAGESKIEKRKQTLEFMMNALRLYEGFELKLFEQRTQLTRDNIATKLTELIDQGLITLDNHHVKTTPLGRRFLNDVLQKFDD